MTGIEGDYTGENAGRFSDLAYSSRDPFHLLLHRAGHHDYCLPELHESLLGEFVIPGHGGGHLEGHRILTNPACGSERTGRNPALRMTFRNRSLFG